MQNISYLHERYVSLSANVDKNSYQEELWIIIIITIIIILPAWEMCLFVGKYGDPPLCAHKLHSVRRHCEEVIDDNDVGDDVDGDDDE